MTIPRGAARVHAAFASVRDQGRPALIAYLVAGYPDDATSLAAAEAALGAGADMLELGIPFSDPVADGPVIAAAAHATVDSGGGLDSAVRLARSLRERGHEQPLLAMGYLNPLLAVGRTVGLRRLADAGVDALIVPDLPAGEDPPFERAIRAADMGACFLVAPNTTNARVERAIKASTAFLYVVPLYGVTGARERVADAASALLDRIGAVARGRIPVVVGFGVSRAEHVRSLGEHADGVVIGSAVVAALNEAGAQGVASLVGALAG